MPFFEDVDNMTIVERHIRRVNGLETTQAKVLLGNYKKAIEEIRGRLLSVTAGTYTQAQLLIVQGQLEQGIKALERRLNREIGLGVDMTTDQGKEDLVAEINALERKFNGIQRMIPVDLILASADRDNFLFNQFKSSIQAYNETLRNRFQQALTQGIIQKKPMGLVADDIAQAFGEDQWKILRIVRTELHQIYNVAKMKTLGDVKKKLLPDLKKTLIHPMDGRTGEDSRVAAAKNLIVDVDEPFRYSFTQGKKTIKREFMAPPDRPNDRSILVPYRSSYDAK